MKVALILAIGMTATIYATIAAGHLSEWLIPGVFIGGGLITAIVATRAAGIR